MELAGVGEGRPSSQDAVSVECEVNGLGEPQWESSLGAVAGVGRKGFLQGKTALEGHDGLKGAEGSR